MAYYEGEINPMGYGNNCNDWGNSAWWIIILLIFGWGNNGWGNNRNNSETIGYELGKLATTNDVASGFSTSTIMSTQRDSQLAMQQGFSDVQQTLCQGFNGINTSVLQGFHGVDNAVCTLGYQTQQGFNSLSHQLSDCCCGIQRSIDNVNYNMAKNTCDIIQNQNCNTQRIIDYFTNEKISSLQSENAALTAQLSQNSQTSTIISALSPKQPIPAYPVFPATSFAYPSGVTFGVGNGCGYNCNCGGVQ